ncbi:hypothetical protein K4F52_005263 [Lecanicillium sp. MT-2017a]|nr:hypothetical protein K4F52_005263 [Lecanicillium sp. MT-2017a]
MSQKVNSKNLSYNSSLPPFLAALQAQAKGSHGPDPIIAAQRRPGKKRSGSEEAEDVPLVVDEHGNTVAVNVDKDGAVKERHDDNAKSEAEGKEQHDDADKPAAETRTQFGGRKRKVGKVVGEDAAEQTQNDDKGDTSKKDKATAAPADKNQTQGDKKTKKKAKKIKLSFDED